MFRLPYLHHERQQSHTNGQASRKKKVFGMTLFKIRHLTAQRKNRMFAVKHHSVMSLKVAPETQLKFLN